MISDWMMNGITDKFSMQSLRSSINSRTTPLSTCVWMIRTLMLSLEQLKASSTKLVKFVVCLATSQDSVGWCLLWVSHANRQTFFILSPTWKAYIFSKKLHKRNIHRGRKLTRPMKMKGMPYCLPRCSKRIKGILCDTVVWSHCVIDFF